MKKYITFLLLIVAIGVKAQTKIRSAAIGDSIWLNKGAIEIRPVIVTVKGDTARSLSWVANEMARDTTIGFKMNVSVFDRTGALLATFSQGMPPLTNVAGYVNGLDALIMYYYPRFSRP